MTKELTIIGSNTLVDLVGVAENVQAKIDTGADSSSLWASEISVDQDGILHYKLFDKGSPLYTGIEHTTSEFNVASVVSSSGHREIRYKVKILMRIGGRNIKAQFNLSNRSEQKFPVLIGRRTLKQKFLVDVSKREVESESVRTNDLNHELQQDPHAFFKKYHNHNKSDR